MTAPITSSAAMVLVIQQQLADIAASKTAALTALATALTAGPAISYTISGKAGAETVGAGEYISNMRAQVVEFTKLELDLLATLQSLQPYSVSLYLENSSPLMY